MKAVLNHLGFVPPAGATDCHVHVFDPQRFPYASERRYTPAAATVDELLAMHHTLAIARVVLVQPSVYGTDNRCLLSALAQLGPRARGVAVLGTQTTQAELQLMHQAGVRAARLNMQVAHLSDPRAVLEHLLGLQRKLDGLPWVLQIYASLSVLISAAPVLQSLSRPVLIDHFGMVMAAGGVRQSGMHELLGLLAHPNIYIKLSGPYQISSAGPDYGDVAPIAKCLIEQAPDRVVWGSDWPHPQGAGRRADQTLDSIEAFRDEDDAHNFSLLADWCPDAELRRRLLVDNPAKLFGFDD